MDDAPRPAQDRSGDEPGLSQAAAAARLAADGPNVLPEPQGRGGWRLLRDVATEPMLLLLLACGAVYMALGDRGEATMLLGFVVVVIALSVVQQRRTERSLDALRDLSSPRALVLRDGRPQRIAGRDLVRGDLVLLEEGDRVPADLALVRASNLMVDESLLTGESAPVARHAPAHGKAGGDDGAASALGRIGASLAGIAAEPT